MPSLRTKFRIAPDRERESPPEHRTRKPSWESSRPATETFLQIIEGLPKFLTMGWLPLGGDLSKRGISPAYQRPRGRDIKSDSRVVLQLLSDPTPSNNISELHGSNQILYAATPRLESCQLGAKEFFDNINIDAGFISPLSDEEDADVTMVDSLTDAESHKIIYNTQKLLPPLYSFAYQRMT